MDGKMGVVLAVLVFVSVFPSVSVKPASSRHPSPIAVRRVARCTRERSPSKYMAESQGPMRAGSAITSAMRACSRCFCGRGFDMFSDRLRRVEASVSMEEDSSEPKVAFRRIRGAAVRKARETAEASVEERAVIRLWM